MIKEFVTSNPFLSIVVITFVVTVLQTWAYKKLTDQKKIKELREKIKGLQGKIKAEKDKEKQVQIQKELMPLLGEQMRLTMRPTLYTFAPLILIFIALRWLFSGTGTIIPWSINIPLVCDIALIKGLCDGAGWFLSYILFGILFSTALRKIFKVQ